MKEDISFSPKSKKRTGYWGYFISLLFPIRDLKPFNGEGQPNGYWEAYYSNGILSYRGHYINGMRHGVWLEYHKNGYLWYSQNYINNKRVGYSLYRMNSNNPNVFLVTKEYDIL